MLYDNPYDILVFYISKLDGSMALQPNEVVLGYLHGFLRRWYNKYYKPYSLVSRSLGFFMLQSDVYKYYHISPKVIFWTHIVKMIATLCNEFVDM